MFLSIRFRRTGVRTFALVLFVMIAALAAGGPVAGPQGTPQPAPTPAAPAAAASPAPAEPEVEKNVAMETFIQFLNRSPEATLRQHRGLTKEVVDSIMANRAAGKSFQSAAEFRKITKISSANFEAAFKPFFEADLRKTTLSASRKPIQPVTATDPKAATKAAPDSPPQSSGEGPIGAVRAGYYAQLEGYTNWDGIDPAVKKEFFETINRERCTCGCTNETLAWCYVNDSNCPVVRPRVKKIHDDLMKRAAANAPAPGSSTPK